MEAINYARDSRIDVVLVDTAGRMQVRGYFKSSVRFVVILNNWVPVGTGSPFSYGERGVKRKLL